MTVQASRYAAEVPVFHAKRDALTSAEWPSAVDARSSPERMSVTSAHAPSENTRSGGRFVAASTSLASAHGSIHVPPRARQPYAPTSSRSDTSTLPIAMPRPKVASASERW